MKMIFWIAGNYYGKLFGWRFLSGLHHSIINLSLHALGYGNSYRESFSGEKWFIKEVLSKNNPKTIIDVGANIGSYTKMLLSETSATVYSIEPNPAAYRELCKLPDRVVKLDLAVSDYDGEGVLHFRNDFDEKATLTEGSMPNGHEVIVKTSKLSTVIRDNNLSDIDFLKIDTEGFEREVLVGLGELRPKFIQFEFNINHLQRHCTLLELTEFLPDYTFYRLLPNGWIKINPNKYLDNIFIFCNVIAVSNSK